MIFKQENKSFITKAIDKQIARPTDGKTIEKQTTSFLKFCIKTVRLSTFNINSTLNE